MEDQLVSFETAKLAKEKRFNEPVENFFYLNTGNSDFYDRGQDYSKLPNAAARPTQSLLQKWLRDKHQIHIQYHIVLNNRYKLYIGKFINGQYNSLWNPLEEPTEEEKLVGKKSKGYYYFDSYEDGLEVALFEALKFV